MFEKGFLDAFDGVFRAHEYAYPHEQAEYRKGWVACRRGMYPSK